MLRDDIAFQTSFLSVAVIMKESLGIDVKKLLKEFGFVIGSLIYFPSFLIMDGVSLFLFFIDTKDLIPIQIFLVSLMFSLKSLAKHFSFVLLRSVDKRFMKVL